MDVKKQVGGEVEANFNTTDGTLEIDAPASAVWLRLDSSDLSDLPAEDYVFDIELTRPDGIDAICSAESVFTVVPEVTTTP